MLNVVGYLFILGLLPSYAFYGPGTDVIELDTQNFERKVIQSDDLWVVEFYAPWCGHCQSLAPEWKKAASALQGVVKIGAVDADQHGSLGSQYGVRGFPTIKIFGGDKKKPTDYQGGRDASSIVRSAMDQLRTMVMDRLSGGRSGHGKKSSGGQSGDSADDVIELTDSNFEDLVFGTDDMVMIEFFAPWCGHCKALAPHWAKAATELKGKVKLMALDATVHTVMGSRYGIRGYPTIKVFPAGKKSGPHDAIEYDGPRDSSGIVQYAMDKLADSIPPPDVVEIVNEDAFGTGCEKKLCVIAFLPIIYDCQAKCRNANIQMLREMGAKYKKSMWGWLWAEATVQPKLEQALGVGGFGYPALVALNAKKGKLAMFKGSFGADGINEFLRAVSVGRGTSGQLPPSGIPKILTIDAWDGKDKELPAEEEDDGKDEL